MQAPGEEDDEQVFIEDEDYPRGVPASKRPRAVELSNDEPHISLKLSDDGDSPAVAVDEPGQCSVWRQI